MTDIVNWDGHNFTVLPERTTWNDVGGVYIFSGVRNNSWVALYIGLTESFQNRHPNHERWEEAKRAGATHIHAIVVTSPASREAIEKALIARFQPPLNTHHKG